MTRARRVLLWLLLGAAVAAATARVVLRSAPVAAAVWSRIERELAARGLEARAGRFELDLLALEARVTDLELARHGQKPFLQARSVRLSLPWSVLTGPFTIERIEVDRARVAVERSGDGGGESARPGAGALASLPIRSARVTLEQLAWSDPARGLALETGGVTITLAPEAGHGSVRGQVALDRGVCWRAGAQRGVVTLGVRGFDWDGQRLALAGVALDLGPGRVALDRLEASLLGPAAPVSARGELELAAGDNRIRSRLVLAADEVQLADLAIAMPEGLLRGAGRIGAERSEIRLAGEGLDLAPRGGLPLLADLQLEASWPGLRYQELTASVEVSTRATPGVEPGELPFGELRATLAAGRLQVNAVERWLGGTVTLDLNGGLDPAAWRSTRLAGTVTAHGLDLARFLPAAPGPARLAARIEVSLEGARIAVRSLEAGPLRAEGELRYTNVDRNLAGAVALAVDDVARLAPGARLPAGLRGPLRVEGRLSGRLDEPRLDLEGGSGELCAGTQLIEALRVQARLSRHGLEQARVRAGLAGGEIEGVARIGRGGELALELGGRGLAVAATGADSRLDFDANLSGTWRRPRGRIEAELVSVRAAGLPAQDLRASLALDGERLAGWVAAERIDPVALSIGLATPYPWRVSGSLAGADLRRLAALVPGAIGERLAAGNAAGSASFAVDLAGRAATGGIDRLGLEIAAVDLELDGHRAILGHVGRIEWTPAALEAELELCLDDEPVTVSGSLADEAADVRVGARVRAESIQPWLDAYDPAAGLGGFRLEGWLEGAVDVVGARGARRASGSLALREARLGRDGGPALEALDAEIHLSDSELRLAALTARVAGAELSARGHATLATSGGREGPGGRQALALDVRLAGLDLERLAGSDGERRGDSAAGVLDATLALVGRSLDPGTWSGALRLEPRGVALGEVALACAGPGELRIGSGRFELAPWRWTGDGIDFTFAGALGVEPGRPLAGSLFETRLEGDLDLRVVSPFVRGLELSGPVHAALEARGSLLDPRLSGRLEVRGVDLWLEPFALALAEIEGAIVFDAGELAVERLAGQVNGGELEISGRIAPRAPAGRRGRLSARIGQAGLSWPRDWSALVEGELALALDAVVPRLEGDLRVLRGGYRPPGVLARREAEPEPERRRRPSAASAWIDRLELGIRVRSVEGLYAESSYGRAQVEGDVRVTGTVGRPGILGRVVMLPGSELYFGGLTFLVQQADLAFTDPHSLWPEVRARGQTNAAGYRVQMSLDGPLEKPRASFSSEPPLSHREIVSLLLTGSPSSSDTAATGMAASALSAGLLGSAGRTFGFDSLRIDRSDPTFDDMYDPSEVAGDANPGARITLARTLRPGIRLVLSQSLNDAGDLAWIASWNPIRPIHLRALRRDDDTRIYEAQHELWIGGPPDPVLGLRPKRPKSGEQIASVAVVGAGADLEPALAERLGRRLRLDPGDRFDFLRWQDDRERLLERLRRDGWLEARVYAGRTPPYRSDAPEGTLVELNYRVRVGPRARIVARGAPLQGDLERELRRAWSACESPRQLERDARRLVRSALRSDGFLTARVTARAVTLADGTERELVLEIEPGTRYRKRELRFPGAGQVPAERLATIGERPELRDRLWTRPDLLATAVARELEAEGLLAAVVTAGTPRFEGETAILETAIVESPLHHVRAIAVAGGEGLELEASVAKVIAPGAVFRRAAAATVESDLLAELNRRGYSRARVEVAARVDEARPEVDVGVAVEAGPQQVLAEVEVTGRARVSEGVVQRALRLETGKPLALNAAGDALRRLNEMGAFRAVDIHVEPLPAPDAQASSAVFGPVERDIERVRATVLLEEGAPWRVRYGLQYRDDPELLEQSGGRGGAAGLVADVRRRNLFGWPVSAGLTARLSDRVRELRAWATAPLLAGLPLRTTFFASRLRERFLTEDESTAYGDETELNLEQSFRLARRIDLRYGYNMRLYDIEVSDSRSAEPSRLDLRLARLYTTASLDRRDDFLSPRRGTLLTAGVELGAEFLGSELDVSKVLLQSFGFLPLFGRRAVLAGAARVETLSGEGTILLQDERLSLGGAHTVRGYPESGLDVRDLLGLAGGRSAVAVLNAELRFPLWRRFGGVAFFDHGELWAWLDEREQRRTVNGTGLGLRWSTRAIVLRLDWGLALDAPDSGQSEFYFGIGHAF